MSLCQENSKQQGIASNLALIDMLKAGRLLYLLEARRECPCTLESSKAFYAAVAREESTALLGQVEDAAGHVHLCMIIRP